VGVTLIDLLGVTDGVIDEVCDAVVVGDGVVDDVIEDVGVCDGVGVDEGEVVGDTEEVILREDEEVGVPVTVGDAEIVVLRDTDGVMLIVTEFVPLVEGESLEGTVKGDWDAVVARGIPSAKPAPRATATATVATIMKRKSFEVTKDEPVALRGAVVAETAGGMLEACKMVEGRRS
jgi:hypothetical protein